jgi:hypothetical protein
VIDAPRCGARKRKADIMISDRFTRLFDRLLARWTVYQDAPRDPARVTELAAARARLDDVRRDIATERTFVMAGASPRVEAPRVAISESDLSRLRVAGIGLDSNG